MTVRLRFKDGTEASFTDGPWESVTPGLGATLELLFDKNSLENHAGYDNPRRGMLPMLEREFGAVILEDDGMESDPDVVN